MGGALLPWGAACCCCRLFEPAAVGGLTITLGWFIGAPDNFHLNFLCMACYVHQIRNCRNLGRNTILFNGTMSTTDATDLEKKVLRGRHFQFLLLVPSGTAPMKRPSVLTMLEGGREGGKQRGTGPSCITSHTWSSAEGMISNSMTHFEKRFSFFFLLFVQSFLHLQSAERQISSPGSRH